MPKIKARFGDARDKMLAAPCTMPPRTREGKAYPGGRKMRRAYARLKSNQTSIPGAGRDKMGTPGWTTAGALKH